MLNKRSCCKRLNAVHLEVGAVVWTLRTTQHLRTYDSCCAVLWEPVADATISVSLQSLSWARTMPGDSSVCGYKGQRSPVTANYYMLDGKKVLAAVVDIVVDMERLVLERKLSVGIDEGTGS